MVYSEEKLRALRTRMEGLVLKKGNQMRKEREMGWENRTPR